MYSGDMTEPELVIDHDVDLAPAIVWDALVDPVLVGGWLGEGSIEARVGGAYRLGLHGDAASVALDARIAELAEPALLVIDTASGCRVSFALEPRPGGSRGDWTRLRVTIGAGAADAIAEELGDRDVWSAALRQLDELLRGHPVDWAGGTIRRATG